MQDRHKQSVKFDTSLDFARKKDQGDELRDARDRFFIQPNEIYMDGNSLGMASKDAEAALLNVLALWKKDGIKIWNREDGKYYHYARVLAKPMAKLINADANEVTLVGSTTSNIHQAISTFYHPTKSRYKILVDDLNFPTDRYAVDSQVALKGYNPQEAVRVVASPDGRFIDEDAVVAAMNEDVALVLLPAVLYRSAQVIDMKKLTIEAHKRNIIIGFDLCHAIGAVEIDFDAIQPDFAVWCNYKYLSAGPGAIAGLYINKRHFGQTPGMAGWFGNRDETQFQLKHEFEHQQDASGWQVGTPPLLAMAPLEGVLQLFDQIGMRKIRAKSLDLTGYLMYLIDMKLAKYGCGIGNSREDKKRGGHICLEHDEAYRISRALRDNGVVPDFREPNVIRLAPVALYNTYEEVYQVVHILERIITEKIYEQYHTNRALVV
ncbi:kynureninase [Sphingobacterium sp. lm-10]|uniref:kynureninase n=1 Tax=Sphingobacterium sp. lm-10 TaxID=2944904 RepID=UPI00201FD127|nr:kynureninase [Sphingobacterium sp. lm-10]MCL7986315.1 kynureninase [Sphingobacterium sp. lm-10]